MHTTRVSGAFDKSVEIWLKSQIFLWRYNDMLKKDLGSETHRRGGGMFSFDSSSECTYNISYINKTW